MKNVVIVLLMAALVFLADRIVREENQRYALFLDACHRPAPPTTELLTFFDCLEKVQTRTSWFGHLYYAVTDHLPAVPLNP
jgi:hypothetical protein